MKKYEDSDLKKLQKCEIEILDKIVEICDKHNLQYFLVGGTCLGAVRHSGFIPWDDDIDVSMPREDYNKFLKYAFNEIGDDYFLDYYLTNKYNHFGFLKVRKNNTTFVTDGSKVKKDHDGFYIDIFPIDYNNNRYSKILHIEIVLARSILETLKLKDHNYHFKSLRYPIISLLFYPFSNKFCHKIIDKLFQAKNKKERVNCAIYCGVYPYQKDIYPYDKVFPGKKILFEKKEYYVFNDADYYLSQLYGENYMEIPPVEKRIAHKPLKLEFDKGMNLNTKEEYYKLNKK